MPHQATTQGVRCQRAWARIAGLMYWLVLILDISAMQVRSSAVSNSLALAGSLFTIPLALGLFYVLRPVGNRLAGSALAFRLVEAALGILSTLTGFAVIKPELARVNFGAKLLDLTRWDRQTAFAAFIFTIGSAIFFYLFVRSRYIPAILAWLGLFASMLAFAACLAHLLRPAFPAMTMYAWLPLLLGEISTGLWLAVKSVKVSQPGETRTVAAPASHSA